MFGRTQRCSVFDCLLETESWIQDILLFSVSHFFIEQIYKRSKIYTSLSRKKKQNKQKIFSRIKNKSNHVSVMNKWFDQTNLIILTLYTINMHTSKTLHFLLINITILKLANKHFLQWTTLTRTIWHWHDQACFLNCLVFRILQLNVNDVNMQLMPLLNHATTIWPGLHRSGNQVVFHLYHALGKYI